MNRTRKTRSISKSSAMPSNGVFYSVEKAKVLGNAPSGDIAKKYVNGVLVEQIFVTKDKLKTLFSREIKKIKNKTMKTKKQFGRGTQTLENQQLKQQVQLQQMQIDNLKMQQVQPVQPQVQQIQYQDDTSFAQHAKRGAGFGIGFIGAEIVAKGVLNALFNR